MHAHMHTHHIYGDRPSQKRDKQIHSQNFKKYSQQFDYSIENERSYISRIYSGREIVIVRFILVIPNVSYS